MDDSFLMGVLNGQADVAKQFDTVINAQAMLIAELAQPDAFKKLHRKVRLPIAGRSRIHDARDVGVIHSCKSLTLNIKS